MPMFMTTAIRTPAMLKLFEHVCSSTATSIAPGTCSTLGTLYMFYELSQRFTVRAQAGQQAAIDLIFTVPYE